MSVRRAYADTAFGQIHLRYRNEVPGRPLVLVHGSYCASAPLMEAVRLIGETRPVFAFDLPGAGCSSPLRLPSPTMADYAKAVIEAIDDLGLKRIDLCGLAEGSCIAVEIAIARPEQVERLAIGDPRSTTAADVAQSQLTVDAEGGQFARAWQRATDGYLFKPWFLQDASHAIARDIPDAASLHQSALDILRGARSQHIIWADIGAYPLEARLRALRPITLAPSPLASLIPRARTRRLAMDEPASLAGAALADAWAELRDYFDSPATSAF